MYIYIYISIPVRASNRIPFFSKLHFKKYQTSVITCTLLSYQTTWIRMLHDINSIHTIWVVPTHGVNINALHGQKELQNSLVLSNWNPADPTLAQVPHFAHLSSKNMKHHGVYVNIMAFMSTSPSFCPSQSPGTKKKRHLSHHIDPPAAPSAWPWSAAYSHSRMQAYLPPFYTHGAVNVERFFFENTRYILLNYMYTVYKDIQHLGLQLLILELPLTKCFPMLKHVTFHIARTLLFGLLSTIPAFCIKSLSCMYSCQDRCCTEGCCKFSSATVRSYKKDAWLQTSPWKSKQLQ